jgi:benzoate/toluate 1,2-dioxygenase alpha subunit
MEGTANLTRFDELVDDRPGDKVFRVDRDIYLDPAVFEAEIKNVFEGTWQFLCHESQVKKAGDYFATYIGRQPVYVHRQKDGTLRAFLNSCSHRAAILTPLKQGNSGSLTCRFHGWTYGADGHCIRVKNLETGFGEGYDRSRFDLKRVPRLESYRGFVFGSLNPGVPELREFLGAAAPFVEFIADQSAAGMEILSGSQTYVIHGNWKMQAENAVDGYHTSTVHRVFANTVIQRESRGGYEGMMRTETGRIAGQVKDGSYDLGGGHMVIWAERSPAEVNPLHEQLPRLERDFPAGKVDWMLRRGRNLIVFPNLMINDFAATQVRTFRPLAVDKTEVTVYCLAPSEESKDARFARLRKFEDFFLVSGMATSDDVMALEATQEGSAARHARWTEFHRGFDTMTAGADQPAQDGRFDPATSNTTWDQETLYHGFYRTWRRLMAGRRT